MATTISIFVNPLADRLDCAIRINGKERSGKHWTQSHWQTAYDSRSVG